MLGTGLIGMFYTRTLHGWRGRDRIHTLYSRSPENAEKAAREWGVPRWTADMAEAINDPETDVVVIGLPNDCHLEAAVMAAAAKKAVLCTKPLGRTAAEAKAMLDAVERAGVFHGYLEDLVYTPKTLKSIESVKKGALGRILWTRSRETHPGPHSDWFFDRARSGGGALVDMGCHCIEIGRAFIGKNDKPLDAFCWAATQVHPIEAEDHAIALVRYASGAISQVEVSWTFRGGMDLRDEVSGTEGTIWLDHFLRTGFEMFTAAGRDGYAAVKAEYADKKTEYADKKTEYVAEKAESETGWLFPVGDEEHELGYVNMFRDMLDALDAGAAPTETFYDGYVVNAVIDACYRSAKSGRWEPVELAVWRGSKPAERTERARVKGAAEIEGYTTIKEETMPDGRTKLILKDKKTGTVIHKIKE